MFAENFTNTPPKWLPGKVVKVTGLLSYQIEIQDYKDYSSAWLLHGFKYPIDACIMAVCDKFMQTYPRKMSIIKFS